MSASAAGGCKVYFGGLTEATGITTEEAFKALLAKEDVTPQGYTLICTRIKIPVHCLDLPNGHR